MIDIDYFKRLNDRDGHVAGDACLRSLGKVLAAAIRQHSWLPATAARSSHCYCREQTWKPR